MGAAFVVWFATVMCVHAHISVHACGVVMQAHNTGARSVGFLPTNARPLCSLGNSLFLLPVVGSILAV